MEESIPAFDAFHSIWHAARVAKTLLRVRLVLLTDSIVTAPPPPDKDKDTIRFNYDIRDIERLYRLASSGKKVLLLERAITSRAKKKELEPQAGQRQWTLSDEGALEGRRPQ